MKKVWILLMTAALLSGCGTRETFETVEDLIPIQPVEAPQQFYAALPEEAASAAFQEENDAELYICDGYTVTRQILESGDLEKTLTHLCGKTSDELQLMKTRQDACDRYDFVWTAAGEEGLQLGRACILDDGDFHYTLTVMAREETAPQLQQNLQDMFASCKLLDPEVNLRTGS